MTIKIEDINSAGIRAAGAQYGINEVTLLASYGEGDNKLTMYKFGEVRVLDTNADPVWEEVDPNGFAELLCSVR